MSVCTCAATRTKGKVKISLTSSGECAFTLIPQFLFTNFSILFPISYLSLSLFLSLFSGSFSPFQTKCAATNCVISVHEKLSCDAPIDRPTKSSPIPGHSSVLSAIIYCDRVSEHTSDSDLSSRKQQQLGSIFFGVSGIALF